MSQMKKYIPALLLLFLCIGLGIAGPRPLEGEKKGTVLEAEQSLSGGVSAEDGALQASADMSGEDAGVQTSGDVPEKGGSYLEKEEVALYLSLYGELPENYLTKREAEELGWDAQEGNLWEVAPGAAIGGDRFGNREGTLPKVKGRSYYECDVNYEGGYRGAERIIYSSDGQIYYTGDHYESFELLYGEE